MISPMNSSQEENQGLGGLRAIGSVLGWIIFLPWTIYEWAERNWSERGNGCSNDLSVGCGGSEAGAFIGIAGLILFVCFLPFWLVQCGVELSRVGESPMEWATRQIWFTVGFWLSVILLAWLSVHVAGLLSEHKEDAYQPIRNRVIY